MSETLPVGEAIRTLRVRRGLSARKLSLLSGLSESYVGKIERGECELSLYVFASLARVLSMTNQEILFCVRQADKTAR